MPKERDDKRRKCCAVFALVCGCVLLVLSIYVPAVSERVIEDGIISIRVVDQATLEDSDWLTPEPIKMNYFLFNITNLGQVLEGRDTKLTLTEHQVRLSSKETRFNAVLSEDGNSFSYSVWSQMEVPTESDEILGQEFVAVNVFYVSVLSSLGGLNSESATVAAFGSGAVALVDGAFSETFVSYLSGAILPIYLNAVSDVAATSLAYGVGDIEQQWALRTVDGDGMFDAHGDGGVPLSYLRHFEIADVAVAYGLLDFNTSSGQEVLLELWNASSEYSLLTAEGAALWGAALATVEAAGLPTAELLSADVTAPPLNTFEVGALVDHFNSATFKTVVGYLQSLRNTTEYEEMALYAVREYMLENDLWPAHVPEITSLERFSLAQFGSGAALHVLGLMAPPLQGNSSRSAVDLDLDPRLPVATEVGLYADFVHNGAYASLNFSLTPTQADKFFTTFSNSSNVLGFASAAATFAATSDLATLHPYVDEGGATQLEAFAGLGLSLATLELFVDYLTSYLPVQVLWRGSIIGYRRVGSGPYDSFVGRSEEFEDLQDGIGTANSGLFCRRTGRELLFGYVDALGWLVGRGAPLPYYGMLSVRYSYNSIEAQSASPTANYDFEARTGKADPDEFQQWIRYRGMDGFNRADEVTTDNAYAGGSGFLPCPPDDPVNCLVYHVPVTIRGLNPVWSIPPFTYQFCDRPRDGGCLSDPPSEVTFYNPTLGRPEEWTYVRLEDVKGLITYRYELRDPSSYENLVYRNREAMVVEMSTLSGGIPIATTRPYAAHTVPRVWDSVSYPRERAGLTDADFDNYLNYEVYSGFAVRGNISAQLNLRLEKSTWTLPFWDGLFNGEYDTIYLPVFWLYVQSEISSSDAKSLSDILYATQEVLSLLRIAGWFLSLW